jgi:hypothetical protein
MSLLIECLATTILLAGQRPLTASSSEAMPTARSDDTLRVAAIQMTPKLGAVEANLAQAEGLVREAAAEKAALIVLPEMFTSAAAFHYDSPELPDVPYRSAYLGEAMITDASGDVLARRQMHEGAGVVTADVVLPANPAPSDDIPDRFWLPEQMPQEWIDAWERWFARGSDYYQTVTLSYLASGEIEEYVPPYLR